MDSKDRGIRLVPHALLVVATATLGYVVHLVAQHTVDVVQAQRLLPRWDLATHLSQGWLDYHLLATGRIPHLIWDLWLQGYWPPVPSIFQIPFYLVLGGRMTSGLWSSLAAFVLAGIIGCAALWRQSKRAAVLPASVFLALLTSSPFLLAYASIAMTEVFGALAQLVVLFCHVRYREHPDARTARLFAISLTLLFFTKYNYFLLLAGPLALYEWLDWSAALSVGQRLTILWRWARQVLSSPTAVLVALYLVAVLIITRTGGFEFRLLGQRISVHSIGNTGHIVLYLLLARLWYLHRRDRIDWARLTSADPRVRPLLRWFVLPVIIWLASPYPNHIRDFANLVINLPVGEPTVSGGLATYVDALRSSYFYNAWLLVFVFAAVGVAAVQYRRQPPLMRVLLLAIPLQFAVIALHHARWPRYLLLTVVLLCLAAAGEVGRWFAGSVRRRLVAGLLAPIVLGWGVMAARHVVTEARFRTVAFEHYVDSDALRDALDVIRAELTPSDRLAITGQTNELSQALFRWELGPPSGVPCFPFEMGGARRLDLSRATRVLAIAPLGHDLASNDEPDYYEAHRRSIQERVARGEFVLGHDVAVPDLLVRLRLYNRASPPEGVATCQW